MNGDLLNKALESPLTSLSALLRRFLSGFVGILYTLLLVRGNVEAKSLPALNSAHVWLMVATGIILGVMIYAVHRALVYPLILYVSLALGQLWLWLGEKIKLPTVDLDFKRWSRRHPGLTPMMRIQKELDTWGSNVMFLYCSGWAALIVPRVMWKYLSNSDFPQDLWWWWLPGVGLVVCALISDISLTARELCVNERGDEVGNPRPPNTSNQE